MERRRRKMSLATSLYSNVEIHSVDNNNIRSKTILAMRPRMMATEYKYIILCDLYKNVMSTLQNLHQNFEW